MKKKQQIIDTATMVSVSIIQDGDSCDILVFDRRTLETLFHIKANRKEIIRMRGKIS